MRSARDGDAAECERLIARGAGVNARVPTRDLRELIAFLRWMQQLPHWDVGYTPLMYGVKGANPRVVRTLVEKGADVNATARGGDSALDLAIADSRGELVDFLLRSGGRVGEKQLISAVSAARPGIVQAILNRGVDVNAGAFRGRALIVAAMRGDPRVVEVLIRAGADLNARDRNEWTALRWAKHRDHAAAVQVLEAAGARDDAGHDAALFAALNRNDPAGARAALKAGANPNAKDERGASPLVWAARSGDVDTVDLLLKAGADVDRATPFDATPLIAAAQAGHVEVVRRLLAAGADANHKDRILGTALDVATNWQRREVVKLLLASNASATEDALGTAALRGDAATVKQLLERGADPKTRTSHALFEAARGGNAEVIRMLLEAGANPAAARESGETPLHRAASAASPEAVRLLLARGADPNAKELNGYTPLISAASTGQLENVRALVRGGANVNARDDDGKSALWYAARYPDVQSELRGAGARD